MDTTMSIPEVQNTTMPLVYDDTVDVSTVQSVLFVSSAASSLQTYTNETTFSIGYEYSSTLEEVFDLIRLKFSSSAFSRIGFAFHNNGDKTFFLNGESWFTDSDLEDSQTAFSKNAQFMMDFIQEFGVEHVDFLACKTLQSEKWRKYYQLLRNKTNVEIGASENDTGNMKYGGDWVMESTMEDIRDVYFTSAIENYASLLVATMTVVATVGTFNESVAIYGNYLFTSVGLKIVKIDLTTNTVVNSNVFTSSYAPPYTWANGFRTMCVFGNYLYFNNGPHVVGRLNITDGTVEQNWITGLVLVWSIVTDGTYLYIATYTAPGYIVRVLLNYTGVAPAAFITGFNYPVDLCIHGSYLYTLDESTYFIRKYDVATGVLVTANLLNRTVAYGSSIVGSGNFLYVGTFRRDNNAHGITQISLSGTPVYDMAYFVNADRTGGFQYYTNMPDMVVYNNKLYCASYYSGFVFYVDLPALPSVAPFISARPTAASSITYPATIGTASLTGGSALTAVGGTAVAGTFTISSAISSSVYNAGTYTDVSATFNPTDTAAYSAVPTSIQTITVSKATPLLSARPTSATVTHPSTLSSLVITGGSCTFGGTALSGTFSIHPDLSNSIFSVGTYQDVSAIFTPTSTTNYNTVLTTIQTVTVGKSSTAQLQILGLSATVLKTARYTASDLITANYTTAQLKTAAFTPTELKTAGISNSALYAVFTTPTETKTVTKAVVADLLVATPKATIPISTMIGYTFQTHIASVVAVKVSDVSIPITVSKTELDSGKKAVYAVMDVSGSYMILPTEYSTIRVMNVGAEIYRVYAANGTTILRDNLVTGSTFAIDGLTVVIGSITATISPVSFPPSTTFSSRSSTVTIKFLPAETVSWKYSIDSGSTWAIQDLSTNIFVLGEATYAVDTVQVNWTDASGTTSANVTNTDIIVIDFTGPFGMVVTFPSSATMSTVSVTTLPTDAVSWQYSLDSGSTWTTNDRNTTSFELPENIYAIDAIQIRCTDLAGNNSANITNTSLTIFDLTPPQGLSVSFPSSTSLLDKNNVVSVSVLPSDAVSWQYSLNSGTTWTTKDISSTTVSLADGTYAVYAVQVRCADTTGNVSAVVKNSAQIIIDLTGPTGSFVATFPVTTSYYNRGLLATITVVPSGAVTWEYSSNSGSTWTSMSNFVVKTFTVPNGTYAQGTIQIRCADAVGNYTSVVSNPSLIRVNSLAINYTALSNTNIVSAVNLWITNPTSCTSTYGMISYWDTSRVTNMNDLFSGRTSFNTDISMWDTSSVTTMGGMFYNAAAFNADISNWNVSNVSYLGGMFYGATAFNQNLNSWNTSNCTSMGQLFQNATAFNGELSNWNVSNVWNMSYMFAGATAFNKDIGAWNVSNVTWINYMFAGATTFNQNIGAWNLATVYFMQYMFNNATSFNGDISGWFASTHGPSSTNYMFAGASAFNRNIGGWNVSGVQDMSYMFNNATMFNGDISEWNTINVTNMTYMFAGAAAFNANISSWNTINVTNMNFMFYGAIAFNQPIGGWNITNAVNLEEVFLGATAFNAQNVSAWYVLTNINIRSAVNIWCSNPDVCTRSYGAIGGWDVSGVTNMEWLFAGKVEFNTDISGWNTSNVVSMWVMFQDATIFNQPIGSWDTSKVTNMAGMFAGSGTGLFNQPVGTWNVSNVTDMASMFSSKDYFNQDLSSWDVRKVQNMDGMFGPAGSMNNDLSKWEVPLVTSRPNNFNEIGWRIGILDQKYYPHWGNFRLNMIGSPYPTVHQHRMYIDDGVSDAYSTILTTGQVDTTIPGTYTVQYSATAATTGLSAPSYAIRYVTVVTEPDPPMAVTFPLSTTLTIKDNRFYITYFRADIISWSYSTDTGSTWSETKTTDISSALIPEGTHAYNTVQLMCVDSSGNNAYYANSSYIVIDFTGPFGIALTFPESTTGANFPGNVGTITTMPADAVSWQYSLDTGATWTVQDLSSSTFTAPEGTYLPGDVQIRCTDAVGNNGGTVVNSLLIVVDLYGPVGMTAVFPSSSSSLTYHPTVVAITTMPIVAVSWQYSVDAGTTWTTRDLSSSSFSLTGGEYNIDDVKIRGTNLAGVNSAVAVSNTSRIAIDFTGPWGLAVSFPSTSSPVIRDTDITVTNLPASAVSWQHTIDSGATWTSHLRTSLSVTLAEAIYAKGQIQVKCTDVTENVCVPVTNSAEITIDLISPAGMEVVFPSTTSPAHIVFSVSVTVMPTDATSWHYSLDSGVTWIPQDRAHSSFVLADGLYPKNSIRVNCQDGIGNLSSSIMNSAVIKINRAAVDYTPVSDTTFIPAVNLWVSDPSTCSTTYGDIRYWDTSTITDMSGIFSGYSTFDSDISLWDVGSVTNMYQMFANATVFNADLSSWNVSNVTEMTQMFFNAVAFNQNISDWSVGNVMSMRQMFSGATIFNQPIGSWNVAFVTDMNNMFYNASAFNYPLNTWSVSNVVTFAHAFHGAAAFNQPLSGWNLQSATDTSYMFDGAVVFNTDISGWNVSNVTNMSYMFCSALAFNSALTSWDTSKVINMSYMFSGASNFAGGTMGGWNVTSVTDMSYMFNNATAFNSNISTWVPSSIYNMNYMFAGASAFNQNIGGWNVTTVVYLNYIFYNATAFNQPVGPWNVLNAVSSLNPFVGATSLTYDVSAWRRMTNWNIQTAVNLWISDPSGCTTTYGHISNWDTSNVTNMNSLFGGRGSFNTDISGWNVSNVTNMGNMFTNATAFNQPIGGWDVAKVTTMGGLFQGASSFNQPLNSWNTGNNTNAVAMFFHASAFNQPLNNWNMTSVGETSFMFSDSVFNQPIDSWNMSNIRVTNSMFYNSSFNQPLNSWDVKKVNDLWNMFGGSTKYMQDLSLWETPLGAPSSFSSAWLSEQYTPNWGYYALHTVGSHILTIPQNSIYVDAGVSDTYATITSTGSVNTAVLGTYTITYNATAEVTSLTPSAPAKTIRWVTVAVDSDPTFVSSFPSSSTLSNKGNTVSVTSFKPDVVSWYSSVNSGVTWTTRTTATTSFVLVDGTYEVHALQVKSTDISGISSAVITNNVQIVIDTTVPIGLAVTFPSSTTESNRGRAVTLDTIPSDAPTWQYSVDAGTNWTTWERSVTSFSLEENTYAVNAIRVKCADAVGNDSAVLSNSVEIIVDLTSPVGLAVTIPSSPSNQGITITSLPADAVSWQYTYDGGANWITNTRASGVSSFTLTAGSYDTNAIQVTCQDAAGNVSVAVTNTYTLVIDFTSPTGLAVTFPVSTSSVSRGNAVSISVLPSDAYSWQYSVNGGTSWSVGSDVSFTLAENTYSIGQIQVRCADQAGNISSVVSNSLQIKIDLTAPSGLTVSFPSSTTSTNGNAMVEVTNIPTDAVTWRYSVNSGTDWTTVSLPSLSVTLDDGHSYVVGAVQVSCTDTAGNHSAAITNSYQINIGPAGMTVSFPSSTSPSSLSAAVTITNLPSLAATWSYTVDAGSTWTSQENTSSSFTLVDRTYEIQDVQVKCMDALGNTSVYVMNSSVIIINYYNGFVPSIVIPPGADPTAPITVPTLSSLDLTDTAVVGTTQAEKQQFTTNAMQSLFTANTANYQLVLPAGSILPGYTTSVTEPIYLFNGSSVDTVLTQSKIMGKFFYVLLESGDSIQMQTNLDFVTIVKTGSVFTLTNKTTTTTAAVGDTYDYDGLHVILGSVIGNLVATTVNFVMTAMNSLILTATSATIPDYSPTAFTSDATITLTNTVLASVLKDTFFFRSDTNITTDASFVYYYVDVTKWPDASSNLSPKNGTVTANGYVASDTVGKDFLRDLARQLFGTHLGADLFTNEDSVVIDMNSSCDQVASSIVTLLTSIDKTSGVFVGMGTDSSGNKYLNDNPSTSNISRELFNQLITAVPGRFENIKQDYNYNATEDGFYKMPIIPGDSFTFKLTITPSPGQVSLVPTGPTVLSPRTYTVILNVS